jgi:hypothetical protein
VPFSGEARYFVFSITAARPALGVHPASYPMDTGSTLPGVKPDWVWSSPLFLPSSGEVKNGRATPQLPHMSNLCLIFRQLSIALTYAHIASMILESGNVSLRYRYPSSRSNFPPLLLHFHSSPTRVRGHHVLIAVLLRKEYWVRLFYEVVWQEKVRYTFGRSSSGEGHFYAVSKSFASPAVR